MIIGTAGHIDHGKTTLVRALTGVDTDRLPEERKRGITIELGFAPLVLPGIGTVGVVDVPGHEGFVRTMVAGATGIDVALLVVAADEGVMPQTREHVAVLEHLGIQNVVAAITKIDAADAEWIDLVVDDVAALLADRFSTIALTKVSAQNGEGIDALRNALAVALSCAKTKVAQDLGRLPVDRVFSVKGTGTVVTGTLWSGQLKIDDAVTLLPAIKRLRVKALESHGINVDQVNAGQRAALALAGIDVAEISRGDVLVTGDGWAASNYLRAEVHLDQKAREALDARTRVRFHLGTNDVAARLVFTSGNDSEARVALDEPIVARSGDRFVLRLPSPPRTIGGGIVIDPHATSRARALGGARSPVELLNLVGAAQVRRIADRFIANSVCDEMLSLVLSALTKYHAGHPLQAGAPKAWLRSQTGMPDAVFDALVEELVAAGRIASDGGHLAMADFTSSLTPEPVDTGHLLTSC